jgi:hypothetical protein
MSVSPRERAIESFYFDELTRKHESYVYDELKSAIVEIDHLGRSLRLLMPSHRLPVAFLHSSIQGDLLFAIGKQLDFEDEDGIIEGGDGVLIVGVRLGDRPDTFWVLVWHNLFDTTLDVLDRQLHRLKPTP